MACTRNDEENLTRKHKTRSTMSQVTTCYLLALNIEGYSFHDFMCRGVVSTLVVVTQLLPHTTSTESQEKAGDGGAAPHWPRLWRRPLCAAVRFSLPLHCAPRYTPHSASAYCSRIRLYQSIFQNIILACYFWPIFKIVYRRLQD